MVSQNLVSRAISIGIKNDHNAYDDSAVEVAVHTILYVRQIYPVDLFIRRKKYDTPVFQSRHPALNQYISGAVKAVGEELKLVSTISVTFGRSLFWMCIGHC